MLATAPAVGGAEVFLGRACAAISRAGLPLIVAAAGSVGSPEGPWESVAGPRTPDALRRRGTSGFRIAAHPAWRDWLSVLADARRKGAGGLLLQYPGEQACLTRPAAEMGYRVAWVVHSRLHYLASRWTLGARLRRAAASASVVFAISRSTREALVAAGWPQAVVTTLTPCVEAPRALAAPGPPLARLLVVSRLRRAKGVHHVLGAAAALRQEFPALEVFVAGEGPYASRLNRLSGRLGIHGIVHFLGFIADPAELLSGGGILVHPTFDAGDSIPTVLLEAGLAGLPVVTSRWNGAPEVVEHGTNGLLVEPRSVPALAGAVASLLRNPEGAAAMGRRGREIVLQQYTSDRVAERFLAALSGPKMEAGA